MNMKNVEINNRYHIDEGMTYNGDCGDLKTVEDHNIGAEVTLKK